jgi:N-acetylglucosamine-6-phosphate deacetylase
MGILITNGSVLNGDDLVEGNILTGDDGKIHSISAAVPALTAPVAPSVRSARPADTVIDALGCFVLPGLVEMHTHGLRDVMVDKDDIVRFARLQLENGVTACLPTLAGSPRANIRRMEEILRQTRDFSLTPNLVGFRPEIMYVADASGGPAASLAKPEPSLTEAVWEASGGRIRIWDISPELDGALPFIAWCAGHGIVPSMAHSSAGIERVREAVQAGLTLVTHFYDLFPQPRETDEGVYPAGVTDYINVEDRLRVEIIPDGVHVHPLLAEVTLRCKGLDRVAFITDSLLGSGNPPGRYEGLIPGEPVEVTSDRGIRRSSDDILSGSALTAEGAFRNAVRVFGRTIAEASRLCSRTPARILGLEGKGMLAPGMDADIVIMNADLRVRTVILGGRVVKS